MSFGKTSDFPKSNLFRHAVLVAVFSLGAM